MPQGTVDAASPRRRCSVEVALFQFRTWNVKPLHVHTPHCSSPFSFPPSSCSWYFPSSPSCSGGCRWPLFPPMERWWKRSRQGRAPPPRSSGAPRQRIDLPSPALPAPESVTSGGYRFPLPPLLPPESVTSGGSRPPAPQGDGEERVPRETAPREETTPEPQGRTASKPCSRRSNGNFRRLPIPLPPWGEGGRPIRWNPEV